MLSHSWIEQARNIQYQDAAVEIKSHPAPPPPMAAIEGTHARRGAQWGTVLLPRIISMTETRNSPKQSRIKDRVRDQKWLS